MMLGCVEHPKNAHWSGIHEGSLQLLLAPLILLAARRSPCCPHQVGPPWGGSCLLASLRNGEALRWDLIRSLSQLKVTVAEELASCTGHTRYRHHYPVGICAQPYPNYPPLPPTRTESFL